MPRQHTVSVTIPNGAALTPAISFQGFSRGLFHMPAAWTAADVSFKVSSTPGGTFLPLSDSAGLIAITPAINNAYVIPANVASARYFMLWSNAAGVDTNQGADRVIKVDILE